MNEEIEVIYPSDDEIHEHVSFIVNNSSLKKWTALDYLREYGRGLYIVEVVLMMKNCYKFVLQSFDIRYVFQHYLEVIVIGIMIIFGILIPSTS